MNRKEIIGPVFEYFSEYSSEINDLFNSSESFRELCEDYALCRNTIQKLDGGEAKTRKAVKASYAHALQELENELTTYLTKEKNRSK